MKNLDPLAQWDLTTAQAMALLSKITKKSEALDGAKHFDLTLVPATERPQYVAALKKIYHVIKMGELTQEEFERRVGLKE